MGLQGTWNHREEMPQREVMATTRRTTHLLLPAVTAGSQHQGATREVPFCLAVRTEAKSGVVELKVDIRTEVNPALDGKSLPVSLRSSPSLSGGQLKVPRSGHENEQGQAEATDPKGQASWRRQAALSW